MDALLLLLLLRLVCESVGIVGCVYTAEPGRAIGGEMLRRGESGPPEPATPGARAGAAARFECCFWKKFFPIEGIVAMYPLSDDEGRGCKEVSTVWRRRMNLYCRYWYFFGNGTEIWYLGLQKIIALAMAASMAAVVDASHGWETSEGLGWRGSAFLGRVGGRLKR